MLRWRPLLVLLPTLFGAACSAAVVEEGEDEAEAKKVQAKDPTPALQRATLTIASGVTKPQGFKSIGGAFVLDLPRGPIDALLGDLKTVVGNPKLKTRTEAHVTMLTPDEASRSGLTFAQLSSLAKEGGAIDDLKVECLGLGIAPANRNLQTFYVVVHSAKIDAFRKKIRSSAIDATHRLHVTVGFTDRDLFPASFGKANDGIRPKDAGTCPNPTLTVK